MINPSMINSRTIKLAVALLALVTLVAPLPAQSPEASPSAVSPSAGPDASASPAPDASASPSAAPSPAGPGVSNGEFELKIDQMTFDVNEDQAFEVPLPNGEKVKATLTRRKIRHYKSGNLNLDYSGDFKLTEEREGDLTTITLDHPKSPMAMVQVFPSEVKPEDVPKELLDGIRKEFKDKNAKLVKEVYAVQRDFKTGKITGQAIQYQIGGQTIEVEIYAWAVPGRTLAVTLQWAQEEADMAKNLFDPLATSIE